MVTNKQGKQENKSDTNSNQEEETDNFKPTGQTQNENRKTKAQVT
jgi:hypothetical protein